MNIYLLFKNNNLYKILKNFEINIKVKKNLNILKYLFIILNRLIVL